MSELTYVQEYNAIAEVLGHYIDGNATASSAKMKPAFHESATIYGLWDGAVFGPEIQKLFDVVDTFPQSPNAKAVITSLDIVGIAASARVDSDDVAGSRFTDFFNLLRVNGKWTIVSKLYYAHTAA
ncbi:nuclear transport factor 2 family protein [Agrobacterium tumefaciens]|uniref:nuclear transport factor 2 family protein n=1 Tax=Agrobacterium tumefaciens TaxID=358 RepID=UPI0012B88D66|nr:nuclear transport factor 2 family protein [Agrobacterium tumefaciens]MQB07278.1 nuclear transport factor 2 family protein [Agrobacterium tumefaciens]